MVTVLLYIFQKLHRSVDCDGEIIFEEISGPDGTTLLYAYVDGCNQLFGAFYNDGNYSNVVPYVEGTGYTANITCTNPNGAPCTYTATYGNASCVFGSACTSANGCPGTYGYNCNCIEECIEIPIRESYVDGVLTLTPVIASAENPDGLPADCLNGDLGNGEYNNIEWTSGESTLSITPENDNAAYGFMAVCPDGCTYCGTYNSRGGCWPGRICSDGDPCTINDHLDANCNCVGEPIAGCDSNDPNNGCGGTLSINVTLDPSGGKFLTADLSEINNPLCDQGPLQYVWNGDYENDQDYYYVFQGGVVTLLVACPGGCTYAAEVDLNSCVPGTPCDDDNDPTTIEYYDENCECISFDCPDLDGDGLPDDCDEDQPCEGSISIVTDLPNQQLYVAFQDLECGNGLLTYLWSSGATTASIPYLNEDATYSVTVTCSSGCQYTAISEGSEHCIVGAECETDKSCNGIGEMNENCECIPVTPLYEFDAIFDVAESEINLSVNLLEGTCETPTYQWSTGETTSSINLQDVSITYVVTVSCSNNCEFVAFYSYNPGDCLQGAPCNDGDPCTVNDTFNSDCDCIGTYVLDANGDPITSGCEEDPCTNFIPCDDGDPCTILDQIICDEGGSGSDEEPLCAGIYLNDENGEPIIHCDSNPCIVGFPCNDGDPCTINDALDENCDCAGEQLLDNNGDPLTNCNETNPCTESLVIQVSPTNNYNEVLLTAISSCEDVGGYQWSNGSGASSIVVPTQSGSYSVIVSCGECQYSATYDTDGCLVGLPCNDGLACTENDQIQENCECQGDPIDELDIIFNTSDVMEELCEYEVCIPDFKSMLFITSIDVILANGEPFQINQSLNNNGFNFPYTFSDVEPSNYIQLIADLSAWLPTPAGISFGNNPGSIKCENFFTITNSSVEILGLNGYTLFIPDVVLEATNEGCSPSGTVIGTLLTASFDCPGENDGGEMVVWSDGTEGNTVFIENINSFESCLSVNVTCSNGCTYSATYSNNCGGCAYDYVGMPCDDGSSCTIGDQVNDQCDCVGSPLPDTDGDGVCDDEDICPLGNDNIDLNNNGIPDACDEDIDCTNMLNGSIDVVVDDEACVYCLLLDDPIFQDDSGIDDIYLQSIYVIHDGMPQVLDQSTAGFNFPYAVSKNSNILLPSSLIVQLNSFFGVTSDLNIISGVDAVCVNSSGENIGPNIYGSIDLPSELKQMKFSWGGDQILVKDFFQSYSEPCETSTPYTLVATLDASSAQACDAEPDYLWSTGSTESSIQVSSLLEEYKVTISCGICEVELATSPINPPCSEGNSCDVTDICGNIYDGKYNEYCECIPEEELPEYDDLDGDGYPDHIQVVDGSPICCDEPPVMTYSEQAVEKTVLSFCTEFKQNDLITGISIKGLTLDEGNNYNIGGGEDNGNFFHFPYCIQENCSFYNVDIDGDGIIDTPSTFEDAKRFAYDLQRWAAYNGYEFTTSTQYTSGFCNQCETTGDLFFINTMDISSNPSENDVIIHIKDNPEPMNSCQGLVNAGYNIEFVDYQGSCTIVRLEVKTKDVNTSFVVEDENGINLGEYKFGPVPHKGVGMRAIIECADGCVYDIVTPDADCIVGDPCDSPDMCATLTYTTYNSQDCSCEVLETNDVDEDGVCDDEDICLPILPYSGGYDPAYDDNLDSDNDGIPNCLDVECGTPACEYSVDLSTSPCSEVNPGCLTIREIMVKLPDDSEVAIGSLPFYNATFPIGNSCANDKSDELISYIKAWFYEKGYTIGDVSVDNYTLTISDPSISFLSVTNGCNDLVEFNKDCQANSNHLCTSTYVNNSTTCDELFLTGIRVKMLDGTIVNLNSNSNASGFNFPYATSYPNGSGATNHWNPNFINDLTTVYPSIVVDWAADDGVELSIQSNVEFRNNFTSCPPEVGITWNRMFSCGPAPNSCDDGWDCTINDHYDADCNCVGTYVDSDGDSVCDPNDQCPGYPDHLDVNENGTPDFCEGQLIIPCEPSDVSFCNYLNSVIQSSDCRNGKMIQNNLILINDELTNKLANNPDMLVHLPFPELKNQLENPAANDSDNDGIVDILDPAPDMPALPPLPFGQLAQFTGTHNLDDAGTRLNIEDNCNKGPSQQYKKERSILLKMFMFTVNPGVLVGTNNDDSSNPILSPCFYEFESQYGLDASNYNSSGYLFSNVTGCYIYFEVDCSCNCLVVETSALNFTEDCDPVVAGEICTTDEDEGGQEGYYYVECPPADADPCLVYGIVSNPDYDPYDPQGEPPCSCEVQMNTDGTPISALDSDGDGICDVIDECPGEIDADTDNDGIPDCLDMCDNVGFAETAEDEVLDPPPGEPIMYYVTKEGYATPTGPGDVCDDGNPCTYDDVITLDCKCQGVYVDSDNDGVYDCEDCEYVHLETITEHVEINGGMVSVDKEIYGCDGCAGTVDVDELGNVVDPNDAEANPVANTWRGCDVCPGIPDGDPEDQDEFPMDYDNDGLPDCIDPPFKPICPDDFNMVQGVGLVLRFNSENLAEDDYPEPIKFQAVISSTGVLYQADYLTIAFVREVEEDGEIWTEVIYAHDSGDYISEDFLQAQIVYSDHQTCLLGADDFLPLPCPFSVSISNELIKFESESGNLDLSEISGTFIFSDGTNTFEFDGGIYTPQFIGNQLWYSPYGAGLKDVFQDPFSGTITLPSGLVCEINGGTSTTCELEDGTEIIIGQACDDGQICTHHDKYIDNGQGECICVGEPKPDQDLDGFCDAIDPCPED